MKKFGIIVYRIDKNRYLCNVFRMRHDILFAHFSGTWTIEGDSIIAIFDPSTCKLSANDSGITYPEEMRDSVKRFINLWLVGDKQLHDLKQSITEQGVRQSRATNIDLTGNRLELIDSEKKTTHYKRKE